MRAISQYLYSISDQDEAIEEVEELLKVAPDWFMAHNQAGYVKRVKSPDEAIKHFEKVVFLKPDHEIGYYNLACLYSVTCDFHKSLENLNIISSQDTLIKSCRATGE